MSFLAGRMAATEGAFFREQSKAAAKLLKDKMEPQKLAALSPSPASNTNAHADTLPEILMHSPPATPPGFSPRVPAAKPPSPVPEGSSLAGFSQSIMKQMTRGDGPQPGFSKLSKNDPIALLSPSVPSEATFGPRRWNLEHTPGSQPVPSTANAARWEAEAIADPPSQEEVREGMFAIAKAFGVATGLVFGGAAVAIGFLGYLLEWHSLEDIKTKSRKAMAPRVESLRQWFKPTQQWTLQQGAKWKMEEAERQALGVEFANSLGVQPAEQLKWKHNVEQQDKRQRA